MGQCKDSRVRCVCVTGAGSFHSSDHTQTRNKALNRGALGAVYLEQVRGALAEDAEVLREERGVVLAELDELVSQHGAVEELSWHFGEQVFVNRFRVNSCCLTWGWGIRQECGSCLPPQHDPRQKGHYPDLNQPWGRGEGSLRSNFLSLEF